ncbi:protein FAM169B isoform X2 [Chiroxiphia lanceolata]|uniref:protein FAM169B isoform X2 n=1 Tax=Chiroxiphia lanceolata TaxID=296741 RepID=UPI0013CE6A46|nr:protein FAM169B isoform X2 [Chiroxiphia lanceolata]
MKYLADVQHSRCCFGTFSEGHSVPWWYKYKGCLCLVDTIAEDPEVLQGDAQTYYDKLLKKSLPTPDVFSLPGGQEVKLEDSCVCFVPLYRNNPTCKLLLLTDPKDKETVLAVYLGRRWWPVEDVVKTADPARDGLLLTFAERIVLFVLNYIIFGMLEGSSANDAFFLPHSATECAKILWRNGEAVAFYSVKMKGSLCDGTTSQCYLLPVLDTIFVRRKCRRGGLGMKMLHDFCQSFLAEDALGISCPISAAMYQVCQKFLQVYPEEQKRLWEVEAPGDWSQRVNIWLKIQMELFPSGKAAMGSHMENTPASKPRQSEVDQMNKDVECYPGAGRGAGDATEKKDDTTAAAGTLNPQGPEEEDLEKGAGNTRQHKGLRKRASPGDLVGDKATKQFRTTP